MSSLTHAARRSNTWSSAWRRLPGLLAVAALSLRAAEAAPRNLGATFDAAQSTVSFRVYSSRATRLEVWIYAQSFGAPEKVHYLMTKGAGDIWSKTIAVAPLRQKHGITGAIFYGYRAWGPNWAFSPLWSKGSPVGFVADVDAQGNRFNPNKLLIDPYAREVSHDPQTPAQREGTPYASGPHRNLDSGAVAPKGIVLPPSRADVGPKPARAFKDEIIYEVHLRGLTKGDASIPESLRGTYRGAALKAAYLQGLGVTAVEFLPIHETPNATNDVAPGTPGDNYWGYYNYNFFAPDRRYAADQSPGGPTREWQDMVRAFHARGIKVYVDVVYNHTGEGGLWDSTGNVANLLSWRGLDNAAYYELTNDNRYNWDNTGVGGNFNTAHPVARDQIIDSLSYWKNVMGVDGFRFDLAPVLGNACTRGCFRFERDDPNNALNRAVRELPVRAAGGGDGVDLIAEPWGIGAGTSQLGNFPHGWAEWNAVFRDTLRRAQNKLGVEDVTPRDLAKCISGTPDLFGDDGRQPWSSVNFIVAHDGFTLRDLFSYNAKKNDQPWPYGPSDGGENNNLSWDQGGDKIQQRQAARNATAMLLLSSGVPMMTGGDEMLRTQGGNNNAYNLDSPKNWLNWADATANRPFLNFTRKMILFRKAHRALRPARFWSGRDGNGNGLKDIAWLRDDGREADAAYMNSKDKHFLAYRIDGAEGGDSAASIYVAYNSWSGPVNATLPPNRPGRRWFRAADTAAWMEPFDNAQPIGQEEVLDRPTYAVASRSILVLVEK